MSLDLEWDDAQQAVAAAVAHYARERWDDERTKALVDAGAFPDELWRDLSELGVLAVMTPEGDGGAREAVAALESLGRHALPGPLVDTLVATQLVAGDERAALVQGRRVAVIATESLAPWPERAESILLAEASGLRRARVVRRRARLETTGGEPWGRVELEPGARFEDTARARAVGETALAALLAAAGGELVRRAVAHARARQQFGRAIAEFQAVAHPLADVQMAIDAARVLARTAACSLDDDPADAPARASAARLSARRAALEAAHVAHQVFGAHGVTLEGPVFHLSRRIRQWASHPLPADAQGVLAWMLDETFREVRS
ncbi:MAG: acyl-CoA dehydrogenase family protein [Myxococcota bacterium]